MKKATGYISGRINVLVLNHVLSLHVGNQPLWKKHDGRLGRAIASLVAGLSLRRTGFDSGPVHMRKIKTLKQVSVPVPRFSPVSIMPPLLYSFTTEGL